MAKCKALTGSVVKGLVLLLITNSDVLDKDRKPMSVFIYQIDSNDKKLVVFSPHMSYSVSSSNVG